MSKNQLELTLEPRVLPILELPSYESEKKSIDFDTIITLIKNNEVEEVVIENIILNFGRMQELCLALEKNTSVEKLTFKYVKYNIYSIEDLCVCLQTNKTIKSLEFKSFVALAETDDANNAYKSFFPKDMVVNLFGENKEEQNEIEKINETIQNYISPDSETINDIDSEIKELKYSADLNGYSVYSLSDAIKLSNVTSFEFNYTNASDKSLQAAASNLLGNQSLTYANIVEGNNNLSSETANVINLSFSHFKGFNLKSLGSDSSESFFDDSDVSPLSFSDESDALNIKENITISGSDCNLDF